MLSEKHNSFLRLLKNKGFKEERMTKVGLYAIGKSTTLESNKSLPTMLSDPNPARAERVLQAVMRISVAERSFPFLNLVEMLYQPST
jgi:hypothetical protein